MSDEKVPKKMRDRYDEITAITDEVCTEHLSQEYVDLSRKMAATLSRKRPSPLASGRAKTWAASIVYALGQINFLFDKSQTPHMPARDLCALFDVSQNTASGKAKQIRDALKIHLFDHRWLLPYRWLIGLHYPSRLYQYHQIRCFERMVLSRVGATPTRRLHLFQFLLLSELELAIYRSVINVLDYGRLLECDSQHWDLFCAVQSAARPDQTYGQLVTQLGEVRW